MDENTIRRFVMETGASDAAAQNHLAAANGNYLLAKQNYAKSAQKRAASSSSSSAAASGRSNFGSLAGRRDDDEDERDEFFAGGAQSGMVQLGKDKKKPNNAGGDGSGSRGIVDNIMQKAIEQGAKTVDKSAANAGAAFGGGGQRLGATQTPAAQAVAAKKESEEESLKIRVVFYENGFTVEDDSVLRAYDDPNQAEFLQSIQKGRMPRELMHRSRVNVIDVELVDKKNELWKVPPPPPVKPFAGAGVTLGSSSSSSSSTATTPNPTATAQSLPESVDIDESAPTTSLQIRLIDGTRLVAKFNNSHTLAHVRLFVNRSRPGMSSTAYCFATSFPPKVIDNEAQTLAEAGLLNAVVLQKPR